MQGHPEGSCRRGFHGQIENVRAKESSNGGSAKVGATAKIFCVYRSDLCLPIEFRERSARRRRIVPPTGLPLGTHKRPLASGNGWRLSDDNTSAFKCSNLRFVSRMTSDRRRQKQAPWMCALRVHKLSWGVTGIPVGRWRLTETSGDAEAALNDDENDESLRRLRLAKHRANRLEERSTKRRRDSAEPNGVRRPCVSHKGHL